MNNRRSVRINGKYRSLLSDMLPYEVPLTFNNGNFHTFIIKHDVNLTARNGFYELAWQASDDHLDALMMLIFGEATGSVRSEPRQHRGKMRQFRAMSLNHTVFETIPFRFKVAHRESEPRELSVVHPRNQLVVSEFYHQHSAAIIYASAKSEYSIRRPISVANTIYFKDKTHYASLETEQFAVEQDDREYEVSGSYFVYKDFSNIHRFFESPKYHRSERRFNKMLKLDISKCFDSIYTHTLPWAIIGKEATKEHLKPSKRTFPGNFDSLMQKLNRNETNGIVIGSEFSRIFAEIILQSVDKAVEKKLASKNYRHRVDYDLYRYVDDYFLFYESTEMAGYVVEVLNSELREVKLNLNTAKMVFYDKPIITEITIAKSRITEILDASLRLDVQSFAPELPGGVTINKGEIHLQSTKIISQIKSAIKQSNVSYSDILNYTLAVTERRCEEIIKNYFLVDHEFRNRQSFIHSLHAIVEFVFFIYSGSPKVNYTIRVCRISNIIVETLKSNYFSNDERHSVFKMIFDCSRGIMRLNQLKEFQQIETIYLLSLIKQLGREYWLDASVLCDYFGIYKEGTQLKARHDLNYFAITSALEYMDHKERYIEIRQFMENIALKIFDSKLPYLKRDTECLLLFLDFISCPFVTEQSKVSAFSKFGVSLADVDKIKLASTAWFTGWNKFRFGLALDSKRSRDVY